MEHTTHTTHATTKRVGLDVVNASGNVKANEAYRTMKANAATFNEGHLSIHPTSGLKQHAYRLVFELNREVSIADARYIEEELSTNLLNTFPDIDIHGGTVSGATTDKAIDKLTNPMHGQSDTTLDADAFALGKKAEEEIKELMKTTKEMNKTNTVTSAELIDMAEYLEEKGVEVEDFDKMALAVWNSCLDGDYSEEVAIQILRTIDAMQMSDSYYEAYKPTEAYDGKRITIATFVWFAKEHGYKRGYLERYYVADKSKADVPTDVIEVEQYINPDDIYNILVSEDKHNVLIDSPTGSGKTTATLEAVRRLLDEDENLYVYFAMPTQSLAIQTASGKDAGTPLYGRESARSVLKKNIKETGYKLVVGTYDKAPLFMEQVKDEEDAKVIIIADEAHKEVTDYFFRRPAIKGLFDLRQHEQVATFISLSGTPQEIDKTAYDAMTIIKQRNAKPIFKQMNVVEYNKVKDYTKVVSEVITKEQKEGRKVLAFINNKATIGEVADILTGMGIKTASVTSKPGNETQSPTYRHLMNKQTFPKGVDVVLATNVIADGINILNESENYSCIIAPHYRKSPIFNLSLIKQMTNRFRNPYNRLLVPLFVKEELEQEREVQTSLYGLNDRYETLMEKAERVSGYIKKRFEGKLNEYKPSVLEALNGMFYVNSHHQDRNTFGQESAFIGRALELERHLKANPNKNLVRKEIEMMAKLDEVRERLFKIDKRTIRKTASSDQEQYYVHFPYAFVKGMEQILKATSDVDTVTNYIEGLDKQVSQAVERHLTEIEELKKETEKVKHERIDEVLTEAVFDAVKKDYFKRGKRVLEDSPMWVQLSEVMTKKDIDVLKDVLPFTSHADALRIAKNADNKTKKYAFKRSLKALADLEGFQKAGEKSATALVVDEIKRRIDTADYVEAGGKQCLVSGQIKRIHSELAEEFGESAATIKRLYEQFIVSDKGKQKVKKKTMHVLYDFRYINLEDVSKQYGIESDNMANIYKQFKQELYEEAA